jgi:TRAP-type C4-dicarboxylate transport system substrate-binding protein
MSKLARAPADLANQRIRTIDNPLYVETIAALGGRPVPMAWGEVYTALQLKAIDGVEPDLSGGYLAKMHEVCKFITKWNYSNDALIVTYNKGFWNGLPPASQNLLTEAASDAAKHKQGLDQALEADAEAGLRKAGVTIAGLTPEELQAFKTAVQPVWKRFEPRLGADLVSLVRG